MIWMYSVKARNELTKNSCPWNAFDPTLKRNALHPFGSRHYTLHPLRAVCRIMKIEASHHVFNLTLFGLYYSPASYEKFLAWLETIDTQNRLAIHRFCPIILNETRPLLPKPPSESFVFGEVQKWCRVLQALPNLRHLSFPSPPIYGASYWEAVIRGEVFLFPKLIPALHAALQSCSNLVSWTCEAGGLELVSFLTTIPNLRALKMKKLHYEHVVWISGCGRISAAVTLCVTYRWAISPISSTTTSPT